MNKQEPEMRQVSEGKPIEWDGSQSEFVADGQDANAGIRLCYQLKPEEVSPVLRRTKAYRKAMLKAKIETGVLACLLVLFGVMWILQDDPNAMIFTIAFAILMGLVWSVPCFTLRTQSVKWAQRQEIDVELYPDRIHMGQGEESWLIPLDGSVICEEYHNLMVLHTSEQECVILPLRCVEPQALPEVQAMILAGTRKPEA